MSTLLVDVLNAQRRLGFLGTISAEEAIAHSRWIEPVLPAGALVLDLGSGGGLPGLVVAADRVDLRVVLLDIRERRTDALRRAVGRLGLGERVRVQQADVAVVAQGPERESFDVVTARSFGPLQSTLAWAARLVRPEGLVVVSLPPDPVLPPEEHVDGLVFRRTAGPWGVWVRTNGSHPDERST